MKGRKQVALLQTKNPEQAELIALIARHGVRGLVRVPLKEKECQGLRVTYERFLEDRAQRIRNLIAERTADLDLQEQVFEFVNDLVIRGA